MCIELSPRREAAPPTAVRQPKRGARRVDRRDRAPRPETAPPPQPVRESKRQRRRQERLEALRPALQQAPEQAPLPTYASNVEGLLRAFEDATLPRADWTHAAHLVVALAYAHGHRLDAYTRLREAIRRYNRATGLVETPTRGYHETITGAWFHLVLHFLDVFDDGRPLQRLAEDLVQLYGKEELFVHYSRERLLAPGARAGWVEPDLRPLPPLEPFTPEDRRWLRSIEGAAAPASLPALPALAAA